MGITHVLRGEEWLPSFPLHWLLFEQFGWTPPIFVHCAVIVGSDGKKLSKRHGATRVLDYGAWGFTKEALKNFIALIGWAPGGDLEVMDDAEMAAAFSIDGLQSSPGRFDIEKLQWLNGFRIRQMTPEALLDAILAYAQDPYTQNYWVSNEEENPSGAKVPVDGRLLLARLNRIVEAATADREYVLKAVIEEQQRVVTLADFGEALEFFLMDEPPMNPMAIAKWFKDPIAGEIFDWIIEKAPEADGSSEGYEAIIKGFQAHKGLEKLSPIVHPTRVALTGKTFGPGLFELMAVLGNDRIVRRMERAKGLL